MIIPAPFLKPNEFIIPYSIEKELCLKGKWIILNLMPSLTPENFVGLKVVGHWLHYCFGIPLEIAQQMNADFDGDECNAYVVLNPQSQAECETILNSENNLSSFTMELKLAPCHDMLVTYYLKYNINLFFLLKIHLYIKLFV
ncbi:RPOLA_N domain-containing protein [Nephila pilipes]|uniref:RPOLA_N domain-containing protein n=1 Tax=Nephila pilipes TaxID=299642 RepID=A0A8X6M7B0_NEPPI|nr:RPOLA_N domain-containing protein [Nephila pilipes]